MSELACFKVVGDYSEYRPSGHVSLAQMAQLVTTALIFAHEQKIKKLLVITTDLTGFGPPHLAERYFFVTKWANASGRTVRAAFVALPEMIDVRKFGVTLAENNGFDADIFALEEVALAWLLRSP